RQPGPGDREGAPLPRAVRAQRAAPARRRGRPDRTTTSGQPGAVPVRHRAGPAPPPRPRRGAPRPTPTAGPVVGAPPPPPPRPAPAPPPPRGGGGGGGR